MAILAITTLSTFVTYFKVVVIVTEAPPKSSPVGRTSKFVFSKSLPFRGRLFACFVFYRPS
jgi:hypothetical protein